MSRATGPSLATIQAGRILVLNEGAIVKDGSHRELLTGSAPIAASARCRLGKAAP